MTGNKTQRKYKSGRIERFIEGYMDLSEILSGVLWNVCMAIGVLLVVLVSGQVFTRYFIGWVPTWGAEIARYMGVWIALLLTPAFIWTDTNLQVEILFRKLPVRAQRIVRTVQLIIIAAIGWFIANWGIVYAIEHGFGQTLSSVDLQMFWMYISLPISGVLIVFFAVAKVIEINYYPSTIEKDYQSRFGANDNKLKTNKEALDD